MSGLPSDDRPLDRLVDDELSESDRRALLLQLDQEPGGWRRCATAFLEAQCWRKELGVIVAPAAGAVEPRTDRRRVWRQRLGTLVAMAASFLVAMVLGGRFHDSATTVGSAGRVTSQPVATTAINETMVAPPPVAAAALTPEQPGPSDQWETVTLSTPQVPGGAPETIRLPAVRRNELDRQWLDRMPGAVPADVLQAFQRMGHQVEQQRELVPVEMQDGRRLVVPVDKVEVHFVGRPAL